LFGVILTVALLFCKYSSLVLQNCYLN
jgi:hypothetical protein